MHEKLKGFREKESEEKEIRETLMNQTFVKEDGTKTIRYRCFDPEGV